MSEKLKKRVNKKAAAAMAALALGTGLAGKAKAYTSPNNSIGTAVTQSSPGFKDRPERLTMDEATQEAIISIKQGEPANIYHGSVDIVDLKTGKTKAGIYEPVIVYRNGATAQEMDFASQHPRSKYWAIGYIQRGVEGNLGHDNLVLLPFNNGGNNFVFHKEASKVPTGKPAIGAAVFTQYKDGTPNIDNPLDTNGQLMVDKYGQPLQIGQLHGPEGSIPTPEV